MGQTDSKQFIVCSFCKSEIITSNNENNEQKNNVIVKLPSNAILCPRCHGFYQQQTEHSNDKRRLSFFGNENINQNISINNENNIKIYIKHLHIAPFDDTINDIEEKEISENYIINTYLKPYFSINKNIKITTGNRIIIKNVEFKVFGCYPPKGYINQFTQFHLNDNNGKLIKLKWRPIRQIHLLPTKASHLTYNKIKEQNNNNNIDDEKKEDDENEQLLLKTHLKPYLKQNDNNFYLFENNKSNKMNFRHLMEEETFSYNGIEWRVMKCLPFDGYINNISRIYCHGEPIFDCNKMSIRPIYESLPNGHKHYTPKQIKREYLDPFFYGRCRYIDHSREIRIFGVDFSIRNSLPSSGIITLNTQIDYNAVPIKYNELIQMQAQEDMELARQLQQEENNRLNNNHNNNNNQNNNQNNIHPNYHQVTLADITEIFERLQSTQNSNNINNNPNNDPFLQFIRQLQIASQNNPRRQRNSGVNPQLIDRLPTFKYKQIEINNNNNNNNNNNYENENVDINKSCRICLEHYQNGEELRFLPCFHKYHKECVDKWFQMSSKCPICKTSITQQLR